MGLRALMFDCDGVLADTEPVHFRALRRALAGVGVLLREAEFHRLCLGRSDADAARAVLTAHGVRLDSGELDRLLATKDDAFGCEMASGVPAVPGSAALVRRCAKRWPLALVSGSRRADLATIVAACGLTGCFAVVVGAEDAAPGKPDPAPYRRALQELRRFVPTVVPRECVAVEDSPAGVASARAAGIPVLGLCPAGAVHRLDGATRVASSLAGVDPEILATLAR